MPVFQHTSALTYPVEDVYNFHDSPEVIKTLVMPGTFAQILRDDRLNLREGELEFRLWFGPIPLKWLARHEPGKNSTSFVDRMISGPLEQWVHEHRMEVTLGGSRLTDRVTFKHYAGFKGIVSRLFFNALTLKILFIYRHWVTRKALNAPKN